MVRLVGAHQQGTQNSEVLWAAAGPQSFYRMEGQTQPLQQTSCPAGLESWLQESKIPCHRLSMGLGASGNYVASDSALVDKC